MTYTVILLPNEIKIPSFKRADGVGSGAQPKHQLSTSLPSWCMCDVHVQEK